MPRFYQPSVTLNVGEVAVQSMQSQGLRMAFSVSRTVKPEPDTASCTVYNLSEGRLGQLCVNETNPTATLSAGWGDEESVVFVGHVDAVATTRTGVDVVTEIHLSDGRQAVQDRPVQQSFGPHTTVPQVMQWLQKAMQLAGDGDTEALVQQAWKHADVKTFDHGYVVQGHASKTMDTLTEHLGLQWWIRDGTLQLVEKGKPLTDAAVVLSPHTGLLHATLGIDDTVSFVTALDARLVPGRQVVLKDIRGQGMGAGVFRLETVELVGDTHGGVFEARCTGRAAFGLSQAEIAMALEAS